MTLETGRSEHLEANGDDLRDLIHPDRARSNELGRTSGSKDTLPTKSSPREQPAKEVDPLAHEGSDRR